MRVPLSIDALEILDLALVPPGTLPLYGVGLAASRITIADQQRRAINIIWALLREGRVQPGDSIAVVGAGVAGVTAAAYGHQLGLRVALFEQRMQPFTLQQGSSRWLHPNIYDWPEGAWSRTSTALPCMNWGAGLTRDVIATLRKEWVSLAHHLDWNPGVHINEVVAKRPAALLIGKDGREYGPYTAVVLAVGFGEEEACVDFDSLPYWRDDDLHQKLHSGGTVFVSGCGDGGLIDTIRVCLWDFRHEWLSDFAASAAEDEQFVEQLIRIEHDNCGYPDGAELTEAIRTVTLPSRAASMLSSKIRQDVSVLLNARLDGPLARSACLLNRLIVAQLMNHGRVEFRQGAADLRGIHRADEQYTVPLATTTERVSAVVIRHGPSTRPLDALPAVAAKLQPARSFLTAYRAGVDRSRRPLWGDLPSINARITVLASSALSPDLLDFLASALKAGVKDEWARRGKVGGVVGCGTTNSSIELSLRVATIEDRVFVRFSTDLVTLTHPTTGRSLEIKTGAPVGENPAFVLSLIKERISDVLTWLPLELQ